MTTYTKEHLEAWINLHRVLSSLSPHEQELHFKMNVFGEKTACGTVYCAAGYAACDPWFHARGLEGRFFLYDHHKGEYIPAEKAPPNTPPQLLVFNFLKDGLPLRTWNVDGLLGRIFSSINLFYETDLTYPEVMAAINEKIKDIKETLSC